MSRTITVELSDAVFAALELGARAANQSAADLAAAALEQRFGNPNGEQKTNQSPDEAAKRAARERFRGNFGAVNLGHATGADNESIDADLARAYADPHEEG
jgi:predicted transcriptional regulator